VTRQKTLITGASSGLGAGMARVPIRVTVLEPGYLVLVSSVLVNNETGVRAMAAADSHSPAENPLVYAKPQDGVQTSGCSAQMCQPARPRSTR
jgi:hypothetical protein